MNTYLIKLFDKYNISERNRYEILQIYSLLPDDKKQNLINNFAGLAGNLNKIEQDVEIQRKIILWDPVEKLKEIILENREKRAIALKKEMEELKKEL